jgi:tetratricopeptide (TPR) repeat protein
LEKGYDQQIRVESKTRMVEQINAYLRSGDYSRALDLLPGAAAAFPDDAQFSELQKLAEDGIKRKAEADRLITESQQLFAQRKSTEAIQLLQQAYELDKKNSLARAILANALVEHAHSVVETDWLEAETLANQALALNPAHPTAKTILNLMVEKKKNSSVEDWVSRAHKLQSSGDLFAALGWVAEALAVHPHDPKLLQIQDAIQRDQDARRRQARRGDLEDLRRLQREIAGAADVAAKQALALRIQTVAAKHWTDGEILSIANALLLRLGLVPQENSTASPRSKSATVILHVPRPSTPNPARADASPLPTSPVAASSVPANTVTTSTAAANPVPTSTVAPSQVSPSPVSPGKVLPVPALPSQAAPQPISPPARVRTDAVPPSKVQSSMVAPVKIPSTPPEPRLTPPQAATIIATAPAAPAAKITLPSPQAEPPAKSNSTMLILASAAAIVLVAAISFFAGKHEAPTAAKAPAAAPTASAPASSAPASSARASSAPVSVPIATVPPPTTAEPAAPVLQPSSDSTARKPSANDQPPATSDHKVGTLLVVAGQDDARIFLNGKLQAQRTQSGQLRLPNLEPKDYVVQVSKSGFQDPAPQKIRIRKDEESRLIFDLQPQPRLASLAIQGGAPGTTVFIDQTAVGTIPLEGTLSVSSVSPGDHIVELRKERFKPRQFKKHFAAGETISLAAPDTILDAAPGQLKITFSPPDATVAVVKGDLLKMVSSGVPLSLPAGTYTLTARTAEKFTTSSTFEIIAGQSKTLDLSLAPTGMSKWDDPGAWKHEGDSFTRKGGDFVLYGVAPSAGTFTFSAMPAKGHLLQWVLNYSDPKNYVLFQMDDNNFYRSLIHNGQKTDEIIVPHKADKKSFRTLQIRVSSTEIVHQIKHGESWIVLDRWTQAGASLGKFGFYLPGNEQIALINFAHYADLNLR